MSSFDINWNLTITNPSYIRSAQRHQGRRLAPRPSSLPTSPLPPRWPTSPPPPSPPPTSPSCPPTAVRGQTPTSWWEGSWWTSEPPSTPRTPCPPPSPPPSPLTSPVATWRWRRTSRACPRTSSAPSQDASPSSPPPPSTRSQWQRFNEDSLLQSASTPLCLVEFSGGKYYSQFYFCSRLTISEPWQLVIFGGPAVCPL